MTVTPYGFTKARNDENQSQREFAAMSHIKIDVYK